MPTTALSPQLRDYLDTWTLATWREYLRRARTMAENIFKRELTMEERKRLRRQIFRRFHEGMPGSSGTAGIMFAFYERHPEAASRGD